MSELSALAALLELADSWETEARNYRIAEPVHFRALAQCAERHASELRSALGGQ